MAKPHPMLATWKPETGDAFDTVKAAHLLNRAGFGGTNAEIDHVLSLGPEKAVDWLLDFPDAGVESQSPDQVPDMSAIEGYPRNFRELRELYVGKTPDERMLLRQKVMQANGRAVQETVNWWMKRMGDGPYPLQEKLTFFWHGHFTTSAKDERSAWLMWQQNELLRTNAAGNFKTFVKQISRDPAMLDYLNNSQNRKASPNENYARELMELFTLGIGNYSENDIKEAARAFTGWAHDGEDFVYRRFDHDSDPKTFFGVKGNWDGDDIIEMIFMHKACAPYLASKMFRYFVHQNPDEKMAASLGDQFREMKFEIRPLMRMMLTSREFYAPSTIGGQIKSPVQLVVGITRALDIDLPADRRLTGAMNQMGQMPFFPPTVKGWPSGRQWINTSTLFVRYNTGMSLAGGTPMGAPPNRAGGKAAQGGRRRGGGAGFNTKVVGGSPNAAVDFWVGKLIQRPISEDKRAVLLDSMGKDTVTDEAERKLVQLIVSMPEFQLC